MKVILTGSTGFIGNEVLLQCLSNPSITSIVALSRRELKTIDPKLKVILHEDFSFYSPALISQLAGADACIYCLGSNIPIRPPELNRKINFDYTMATARMFANLLQTSLESTTCNKPFRFVYLSGALPEKNQEKQLWLLAENRRMRGELENALLQLGGEKRNAGLKVFIARPGFVQSKDEVVRAWLVGLVAKAIMIQDLAAAMVHVALNGYSGTILENEILIGIGRRMTAGSDGGS
jgi:hypothetical protein